MSTFLTSASLYRVILDIGLALTLTTRPTQITLTPHFLDFPDIQENASRGFPEKTEPILRINSLIRWFINLHFVSFKGCHVFHEMFIRFLQFSKISIDSLRKPKSLQQLSKLRANRSWNINFPH